MMNMVVIYYTAVISKQIKFCRRIKNATEAELRDDEKSKVQNNTLNTTIQFLTNRFPMRPMLWHGISDRSRVEAS